MDLAVLNLQHCDDRQLDLPARRRDARQLSAVRPFADELDDRRVSRCVDLLDVQLHVIGESGPVHLGDGDARVRAALSLAIASRVAVLGVEKLPVARHIVPVNRVYHLSGY